MLEHFYNKNKMLDFFAWGILGIFQFKTQKWCLGFSYLIRHLLFHIDCFLEIHGNDKK